MADSTTPDSLTMATALGMPLHPAPSTEPACARILVVDDDVRMAASLHALLSFGTYQVETVHSAIDALARLSAGGVDLVLLDLRMPGLDGHQTMDLIAATGNDVPVIVVSGEKDIEAAIGALKRGAVNYLRKPFHADELLHIVSQAVHKRRLENERREMQYRLESSERLYRYLVDSLPDIIYTLDPQGCFTYVNGRAEQLLGCSRDQLIGQHYSTLVVDEDLEKARYVFQERRVGERASRNVELRLMSRTSAGQPRYFDNTVLTISFNSTGMYTYDARYRQRELFGTFGVARDITDLKRAEQRITYQAYHDVLTELPNRILFKDRLDLAIIHAQRNPTGMAVMFIDLDGFKLVNDTLGHPQGDVLLQHAASRMRGNLRKGDTLARVGGDEFTLLLPDVRHRHDAQLVARKFLGSLEQPFDLDGRAVHLSASIGIALFPDDGATTEDLVRHADIAMYQVKVAGKNGFGFYEAQMETAANQKILLAQGLRQAIERNELEMYYQPQVDARTQRIIGAEALMRWHHPERGLLSAGEFMPFAEQTGLMRQLSAWMVNAVGHDLQRWNQAGCGTARVSVNLSPQCLDRGDTVAQLAQLIDALALPAAQMEVEITENLFIADPQNAIKQLTALVGLGVSVAVDDFGTGYCSLAYLQRFPVHTLKIDRAFVRDIVARDGHYPMVLAVISIARSIGLNVIAEGVETEEQAAYLLAAGCTTMQGYLFYPALPRDALTEILSAQDRATPTSAPPGALRALPASGASDRVR